MQFDEKWSFVGKKEKHCDPDDPVDALQGDNWDHVALDPEHRLVVSVVPGKRTAEHVHELVHDCKQRTQGRVMNLITTDEYPVYETAILEAYGKEVQPERTGKPGRPKKPYQVPLPELNYATVHKTRKKGRVVKIDYRVVFGTVAAVMAALALSLVSKAINTAFIERHNGTDRNRNGRKVRKTSRLVGVNKNTVVRYSRLAGEHAKSLHDEFVAFSPSNPGGAIRRKVVLRRQERETL